MKKKEDDTQAVQNLKDMMYKDKKTQKRPSKINK